MTTQETQKTLNALEAFLRDVLEEKPLRLFLRAKNDEGFDVEFIKPDSRGQMERPKGDGWFQLTKKKEKARMIATIIRKVRRGANRKRKLQVSDQEIGRSERLKKTKRIWVTFVQGGAPGLVQQRR